MKETLSVIILFVVLFIGLGSLMKCTKEQRDAETAIDCKERGGQIVKQYKIDQYDTCILPKN